jgi:hypothetical protein
VPRKPARPPAAPADILAGHSPLVRALAHDLRALIQKAVPNAVETANPGWHSLNFSHPVAGYFCGLFPRADDVQMAFEFGALLPDPHGLLTGDTRQVRYVFVRSKRDIRARALAQLLRAAVELPLTRAEKLALIRAGARPVSYSKRTTPLARRERGRG